MNDIPWKELLPLLTRVVIVMERLANMYDKLVEITEDKLKLLEELKNE